MTHAEARPQRIDRYELRQTLGRGATGVVYLARDLKLDREVAVKVLHPGLSPGDAVISLFHREAKAIAQLQHPNIIQLYDYSGTDSRMVFLVVERLRGRNLGEVMALRRNADKGPLDPLTTAAIGHEICLALQHAHGRGIVHRDLKPENVFLEPDGRVVLCDFGVARAYGAIGAHTLASQQTKMAGSPLYMSPEQVLDPQSIGPPSDLFSLGSLLYYLATGKAAFGGPSMHKVLKGVTTRPPHPDLDQDERIPIGYKQIVGRLLEKIPAHRFASAQQAADALLALFQHTPHRDLRRLLGRSSDEIVDLARATGHDVEGGHTMMTLRHDDEVILLDQPIDERALRAAAERRVLLTSIAIGLFIVLGALLTREIDAMDPIRAWIRELLRRY